MANPESSRTIFIPQDIAHKLNKSEQSDIINNFNVMKKSEKYLKEMQEIIEGLNSELPQDKIQWWSKAK